MSYMTEDEKEEGGESESTEGNVEEEEKEDNIDESGVAFLPVVVKVTRTKKPVSSRAKWLNRGKWSSTRCRKQYIVRPNVNVTETT